MAFAFQEPMRQASFCEMIPKRSNSTPTVKRENILALLVPLLMTLLYENNRILNLEDVPYFHQLQL